MQLIKKDLGPSTEMKFVISCGYFNSFDEQTHTTDLIVNLNRKKPFKSFKNEPEVISAA